MTGGGRFGSTPPKGMMRLMPAHAVVSAVRRKKRPWRAHSRAVGRAARRGRPAARVTKVGMLWIDSDMSDKGSDE